MSKLLTDDTGKLIAEALEGISKVKPGEITEEKLDVSLLRKIDDKVNQDYAEHAYLKTSGGEMTGDLVVSGNTQVNTIVVTKIITATGLEIY